MHDHIWSPSRSSWLGFGEEVCVGLVLGLRLRCWRSRDLSWCSWNPWEPEQLWTHREWVQKCPPSLYICPPRSHCCLHWWIQPKADGRRETNAARRAGSVGPEQGHCTNTSFQMGKRVLISIQLYEKATMILFFTRLSRILLQAKKRRKKPKRRKRKRNPKKAKKERKRKKQRKKLR